MSSERAALRQHIYKIPAHAVVSDTPACAGTCEIFDASLIAIAAAMQGRGAL